jgi:hypothetical protein
VVNSEKKPFITRHTSGFIQQSHRTVNDRTTQGQGRKIACVIMTGLWFAFYNTYPHHTKKLARRRGGRGGALAARFE